MAETYLFAKLFCQILFIRPIRQALTPPNIPAIQYKISIDLRKYQPTNSLCSGAWAIHEILNHWN